MDFPVIETPRPLLTPLNAEDTEAIFALFSNEAVIAYYDLEAFTTPSQAQELIAFFQARFEAGTGIRWAIRLKPSQQLIGTCGFNVWSSKMQNAVIGYDLMPSHWGMGLATEAVYAIVVAAFSGRLPCGLLHRIQADTVPGNAASEKLLTTLGFAFEGVRRQSGFWKGAYHDLKCYGLLRTELRTELKSELTQCAS